MRTVIARGGFAVAMGVWMGASMAGTARAQGAPSPAPARPLPAARPGATPEPPAAAPRGPESAAGPASAVAPTSAPATNDELTPIEVPSYLVQVSPGGLTAEQAGTRASVTSWNAKASEEGLR